MQALFWNKNDDGSVSCELCFRGCRIPEGASGFCGVRSNISGALVSPWLGRFCAMAVDPVEKKPFSHWRPGTFIYSLGSFGCTMNCPFCQNYRIAKPEKKYYADHDSYPEISPNILAENIKKLGLSSVAFTYNEPALQTEYIISCAQVLKDSDISIAIVTNGAMSKEVAEKIITSIGNTGAANIDLKAFTPEAYKILGGDLDTVKNNIISFVHAGINVELTNLVVPGINDNIHDFANMIEWIASVSPEIPMHVSRYFPARNYDRLPTDIDLIYSLKSIAESKLKYVHTGNI